MTVGRRGIKLAYRLDLMVSQCFENTCYATLKIANTMLRIETGISLNYHILSKFRPAGQLFVKPQSSTTILSSESGIRYFNVRRRRRKLSIFVGRFMGDVLDIHFKLMVSRKQISECEVSSLSKNCMLRSEIPSHDISECV